MNGLPYYKAYPRDFVEGTIGMPFEIKCAYRVVLDLIYMQGGRLPDDARYVAGHLGCSVRKWKAIRADLIERGKLIVSGEFLTNKRADKEIETLAKHQEKQSENARQPRKNKDLEKPPLSHTEPEPDTDTLEANASNGGDAASGPFSSQPIDARKEAIWKRGVPFLTERGVPERGARTEIGKWLRDHGGDAVFDALKSAAEAGTQDPIPYIEKTLAKPERPNVAAMVAKAAEGLRRAQ